MTFIIFDISMKVINYLIRATKEFTIIFENNPVLLIWFIENRLSVIALRSKKNDINYLNVKCKSQEWNLANSNINQRVIHERTQRKDHEENALKDHHKSCMNKITTTKLFYEILFLMHFGHQLTLWISLYYSNHQNN